MDYSEPAFIAEQAPTGLFKTPQLILLHAKVTYTLSPKKKNTDQSLPYPTNNLNGHKASKVN